MRLFLRAISIAAVCFFLSSTAFAQAITTVPAEQPDTIVPANSAAVRADFEQRSALSERLVAAKESPGREFPVAFRAALIEGLKQETYQQLRERIGTGNIASQALGDTKADLVYTTFQQPCRMVDTRLGGGIIASGQIRDFVVVGTPPANQGGNAAGCGVPSGATAVMLNFVSVNPAGGGNLKGAAYPNSIPAMGSVLNYQALTPVLNVANGVVFPICDPTTAANCTGDIRIQANGAATHLIVDVLGYWMRFPKENVKDVLGWHSDYVNTTVGPVCVNAAPYSLPITAPATGKVRIRGNVKMSITHVQQPPPFQDVGTIYKVTLSDSTSDCSGFVTKDQMDFETFGLVPSVPTTVDLPLDAVFPISKGATINFTVNGIGDPWYPFDSATIMYVALVGEFIPD